MCVMKIKPPLQVLAIIALAYALAADIAVAV